VPLVLDNGPDRISRARAAWAQQHAGTLPCIDPGPPRHNAHGERFHGRLRDACRNDHGFLGRGEARRIVETWRHDDQQERPQSALGYHPPVAFAQSMPPATAALPADDGLSSGLGPTARAGQLRVVFTIQRSTFHHSAWEVALANFP
jgi:hypothetical protein